MLSSTSPMRPLTDRSRGEDGLALILVLIFTVLLYAIIAELVTSARSARLVGANDALMARMDNHMRYCQGEVEELLLGDLTASAAGDEGGAGGGLGALPFGGPTSGDTGGGALPGGLPGGEGEEEAEASTQCDGSQDAWYEPTAYTDGDITTYALVEDENSKFNLLTLVSADEEFARESRERFVRLIDRLRESTDFDLSRSDAELMADQIIDWIESRNRTESMPRPPLKSDSELERQEISLPLHLDELMLLRNIDDRLFFDKVLDGRLIYGLESVLTIYTSLAFDPGDPDDPENQPGAPSAPAGDPAAGGESAAPAAPTAPAEPVDPSELEPRGIGIRININTAPRPVLRCLFSEAEFSDTVIDAILEYRNQEVEELDLATGMQDDYLGVVEEGQGVKRQVFTDLAQLDEIPEFANIADPTVRDRFKELVGVDSDVFSIHLASLFKRNEETRNFVLRRRRSIVVRLDESGEGALHPLILLEQRAGMRVRGKDFYEDDVLGQFALNDAMDLFSQEEKAWNPFLLEFYLPPEEREQLFSYR